MFEINKVEIDWCGKKLKLETGKIARQADASVVVSYAGTIVMANRNPDAIFPTERVQDIAWIVIRFSYMGSNALYIEKIHYRMGWDAIDPKAY